MGDPRSARSARWLLVALLVPLLGVGSAAGRVRAQAQPPATASRTRVEVRVRQVAGSTLYVDLGTDHGLALSDTLGVARELDGEVVGRLTVVAASTVRSVLAFAGSPFPVSRGQVLVLELLRPPTVPPPTVDVPSSARLSRRTPTSGAPPPDPPPAGASGASSGTAPRGGDVASPPDRAVTDADPGERAANRGTRPALPVRGRWGLEMAVSHAASTLGTELAPVDVSRTYATPALRLDLTAPRAVGGFELRMSTRTTYRYGSAPGFDPNWSPRVYELSLERSFEGAQLVLGRFHSRGESFSGYWDGASLRVGGDRLGIGVLAGLQPDRWNQLPNSELPKATVFVDFDRGAGPLRWRGDLSAHMVWPADGAPTHTFFGFGQRVSTGRFRLTQELQVDRDPFQGGVRLSRLIAQASLGLSDAVDLRAGIARRDSYFSWTFDREDRFSSRRDRANFGLSVRGAGAYASLDVGLNRDVAERVTRSVTGSASFPRLMGSVGLTTSASWWDGDVGGAISFSPALSWRVGRARVRTGYRFYSSEVLGRDQTTHAPDLSLDLPFADGLRASVRLRTRWGDGVQSEFLQLNFTRVF